MKHTPGPWEAWQESAPNGPWIVQMGDYQLYVGIYPDGQPDEANARLIAAAPLMYDMLTAVLRDTTYRHENGENCRFCDENMDHLGTYQDTHSEDCIVRKIRTAVAKAKGDDR